MAETRDQLKRRAFEQIDQNKDQAIRFLQSLVRIPSQNLRPTFAQELVKDKLAHMQFALDVFPCETASIQDLPDFFSYPENYEAPADIENVVGVRRGAEEQKGNALMIFAHIDTAEENEQMPDTLSYTRDGRVYGLGAADDKSGVAMMLLGAEAALAACPQLAGRLTLMSTIGKRGAVGTLSAVKRGYGADAGVYIHPAETGHGFREIKNYSMGELDFVVGVRGKAGVFRDEIDDSEINAVGKGALVVQAIEAWDKKRRAEHRFGEGSFAGRPNTKVNILSAQSSELLREDPLYFEIQGSVCFGLGESTQSVLEELEDHLGEALADDEWLRENPPTVRMGVKKANPVYIDRESPVGRLVEGSIAAVKGDVDFIYQYHGSSDIRMPNLYGGTPTIGIGPLCGGLSAGAEAEWLDVEDFIDGIKIVAAMILDWCG